jgi:hypothetical protein|nr:MAG TPA: head closure knob [Caudoviricetes sp.]
MIPADIVQKAKSSLQMIRDDRVTVCRLSDALDDEIIYKDIPCHLSQTSRSIQGRSDTAAVVETEFTLFIDSEVEIQTGDKLVVSHKGQTFTGTAGQPFRRDFSLSVKLEQVRIS